MLFILHEYNTPKLNGSQKLRFLFYNDASETK